MKVEEPLPFFLSIIHLCLCCMWNSSILNKWNNLINIITDTSNQVTLLVCCYADGGQNTIKTYIWLWIRRKWSQLHIVLGKTWLGVHDRRQKTAFFCIHTWISLTLIIKKKDLIRFFLFVIQHVDFENWLMWCSKGFTLNYKIDNLLSYSFLYKLLASISSFISTLKR
jgi:hypothetical protein